MGSGDFWNGSGTYPNGTRNTAQHLAGATTYYLDSQNGNDNDVTPPIVWKSLAKVSSTTFSPGDSILLKSGDTFAGTLQLKGSGLPDKAIVLASFGSGPRPIIAANTDTSIQNGNAILLSDVEGWELRNLEITNATGRSGILVLKTTPGTSTYFRFFNLVIHNVHGPITKRILGSQDPWMRSFGGMVINNITSSSPGKFDDLQIENCSIYDVEGQGIQSCQNPVMENNANIAYRTSRLIIRGNTVHDCHEDGIVMRQIHKGLIEKCTVYRTGLSMHDYLADVWYKYADNSVIQYVEAYENTNNPDKSNGQGFDLDKGCTDCVIQYCYSHNNQGGFVLVCSGVASNPIDDNKRNIIRYNLSVDDSQKVFHIEWNISGLEVYNNVIISSPYVKLNKVVRRDAPALFTMKNNIFLINTNGSYQEGTWSNNCFFGSNTAALPADANKLTADPMFANASARGLGFSVMESFKLKTGSPCVSKGTLTFAGGKDYWGSAFGDPPSVGLHSGTVSATNSNSLSR